VGRERQGEIEVDDGKACSEYEYVLAIFTVLDP
jgi:hypothetical protein